MVDQAEDREGGTARDAGGPAGPLNCEVCGRLLEWPLKAFEVIQIGR